MIRKQPTNRVNIVSKQSCQRLCEIKRMLTVFCNYCGVIHSEFILLGQTGTQGISRKGWICGKNSCFLHHDNVPSHYIDPSWVFHQKYHSYGSVTTLFTCFRPVWLLAILQTTYISEFPLSNSQVNIKNSFKFHIYKKFHKI